MRIAEPAPRSKEAALQRMKRMALAALFLAAALYVGATMLETRSVWFGYIAAFAGAAMVGALADWFAVVALFRHPLGVRLPHTAVIPNNQARIADNLGRFIQTRFLSASRITALIKSLTPGTRLLLWLAQPEQVAPLAQYLAAALTRPLSDRGAADSKREGALLLGPLLADADWARVIGSTLEQLVAAEAHRVSVEVLLVWLRASMHEQREPIVRFLAGYIKLPTTFQLDERAGALLLNRLDQALEALVAELARDPEHPLYLWAAEQLRGLGFRLRSDTTLRRRFAQAQVQVFKDPRAEEVLGQWWSGLQAQVRATPESALAALLQTPLQALLAAARDEGTVARWLDAEAIAWAPRLISSYGHAVGTFIADQVCAWDPDFLAREIELHLGPDLQFIRLNGTVVGGLVGLLLHGLGQLLTHGGMGF